jgi:hypothetical protein
MSTGLNHVIVAVFKNNKEAKQAAEKHGAKSLEEQVILHVNPRERDRLNEICASLKQEGVKKIYIPNRHHELVFTLYCNDEVESKIIHDINYQELVITIRLPKGSTLKTLPLTNSPELVETVKLLHASCRKPEIKAGRKIAKWIFKYAGSQIYRKTHNRSRGQFCFYSPSDQTVVGVPKQKEVKIQIVEDINTMKL